ncbi:hypothetical protein FHS83_001264 [Rhizomicrobium palustre]|uniref:Uncharacterized protein n=1 Tax=Rhizomicrobium palustre TaxID=189966 RepID=A0A846MX08_9PROT|nr:DUF6404 family protein [Rhizomicrobium palustre]NIK87946.1 hypothetical protein [Rhizomicrobium palustre]
MAMTERVLDALQEVKARNYDKAPPFHRLCWRFGILIPPPMLAPFWFNWVFLGGFFAITYGGIMALFPAFFLRGAAWRTLPGFALGILIAGAFFGLFMAIFARVKTAKRTLPSWQSLVEAERAERG